MSTASPADSITAAEKNLQASVQGTASVPDTGSSTDVLPLLDDPQEWSAFSQADPHQANVWTSNVQIEGMHCAACALTIEDALLKLPGVVKADVSAGSHRARIVWNSQAVLPSRWMQSIGSVGYRAVPANDAFAREHRKNEARKALWRLSVAGLCMMQVMMYALPAYVAEPGDLSAEMEGLLRWASWVLALPVILFSCGPFFRSAWRDVVHRQISMDLPVALGIFITFAVSTAGTFDPHGIFGREVYFDSLTMFVFFLLSGRWLELRMRDRTAGGLEALMNRLPDSVARLNKDGVFERVAARRLLPGDVIRVLPGETLPADGVVLEGDSMVDESLLTGESRPVSRGIASTVIAGSHNLSSVMQVRVEQVGQNTRFAEIVTLMESASTSKPTMAKLADQIAKPFLIAVLLAAALACAYWWSADPARAVMVAVSVLVVTCPCALSLATPAAMLASAGSLAQRGVLVRRLDALEALAAIDTVMFDKTGTLTRDAMVLGSTRVREGMTVERALLRAGLLAQQSLHPVSRALAVAADGIRPPDLWRVDGVREIAGQGIQGSIWSEAAQVEGATLRLGSASFCGVPDESQGAPQAFLSDEHGWLATFELQEDVRQDAVATVRALQTGGIAVHLLSGDQTPAVQRVAVRVGISESQGACSPKGKLEFLRSAQRAGRKVAFVGDGLNDGPVLASSHVSFAFGQAVPLAQSQADFVVLGAQLGMVSQSIFLARRTLRVVRQNLLWAALYNAVCVPLAVVGWLPAWLAGLGMASSSLLVVLNALRLSNPVRL